MTTYERKAMRPFTLTTHAREAMMLRRVSMDEILKVLATPEVTDRNRKGEIRFFRGKLCVVTVEERSRRDRLVVKTVLYRYGDKWTDEDVRTRDFPRR